MPSYRAVRLGITGKIASGKSTLSRILREMGMDIMDADSMAREVMEGEEQVRKSLIQILGTDAYVDGKLNTEHVGKTIFSNPKLKTELEAVVHTAVWELMDARFAAATYGQIIGVESAILYQTGYDAMFDMLVLVDASEEKIKANALASGKFSEEEIEKRLKVQNFGEEWKEDADYVLTNDCPLEEFEERCRKLGALIRITAPTTLPRYPLRMGAVGQGPKKR